MKVYLFTEPHRAVILTETFAILFFVQEKFSLLWPHVGVFTVHYFIFWERGDRGFWLSDVDSLGMYCIDAIRRIVTKITGLLYPFLYSMCLADGVAYAAKDLGADVILDICTLTGAQVRSAHTEVSSSFIAANSRGLPKMNLVILFLMFQDTVFTPVLRIRNPGSGAIFTPGSGIRDG